MPPRKKTIDIFWYAVATMVGSTIGVGFYGIPFAFQKASFGIGLLFFIAIGFLVLCTNLLYGEVILRTHRRHQFVGYVHQYLGVWPNRLNLFNFWIAVYGSMVGIIIISGEFLSNILSPLLVLSPPIYSTFFIIVMSVVVATGLRVVARLDFAMMIFSIFVIILIAFLGIGHINLPNYTTIINHFWFLPFGVILFALNGFMGVPLAREILIGKENKLRNALILGTIIPFAFYLAFTLLVVGISGDMISPDAISGLRPFLGSNIVFIGSLFGFLTSVTIFLNLATALKESLHEDFKFKNKWAWFLVAAVPYILFISGIRNFIDIIGLVGGVAVSIDMILLIFVYVRARKRGERMPEYSIGFPNWFLYIMIVLFSLAAIYTVLVK